VAGSGRILLPVMRELKSRTIVKSRLRRLTALVSLSLLLGLLFPNASNSWELNSENSRSGIFTTASQFWVAGYGPVTPKRFFQGTFEDDIYWATLNLMCQKKKLSVYIYLTKTGSGHEDIRLDDPGYISLLFNGSISKRYRTYGSGQKDVIVIQRDAVSLAKAMVSKTTLSTSLKPRFGNRIQIKFDVSGLSKAKTRFKYAGCSF